MQTESSREVIRDFVKSSLVKKQDHLDIRDDDNIIVKGILDSLGIIKVINFLEDRFRLVIRDEDVIPDNFETIEALSSFVARSLRQQIEKGEPAK